MVRENRSDLLGSHLRETLEWSFVRQFRRKNGPNSDVPVELLHAETCPPGDVGTDDDLVVLIVVLVVLIFILVGDGNGNGGPLLHLRRGRDQRRERQRNGVLG